MQNVHDHFPKKLLENMCVSFITLHPTIFPKNEYTHTRSKGRSAAFTLAPAPRGQRLGLKQGFNIHGLINTI